MDRKIRVGAVSYLNTKPLIYGFEQGMMADRIELLIDYPANIARQLTEGSIDIGLIPVAAIPSLPEWHIISDCCIASNGAVASVCLFSEVPLDKVEKILLDYQSRTSVALLKIIVREYWKIKPQFISGEAGYEEKIGGSTAGLVIGDRAFRQRLKSPYIYDLGQAWKELTGKPFVYAAWVSNRKLPDDFIRDFEEANRFGLGNLDKVLAENPYPYFNLADYYTQNMKFIPGFDKLEVISLFLDKLKENA